MEERGWDLGIGVDVVDGGSEAGDASNILGGEEGDKESSFMRTYSTKHGSYAVMALVDGDWWEQ